jgi:hypothetical protein
LASTSRPKRQYKSSPEFFSSLSDGFQPFGAKPPRQFCSSRLGRILVERVYTSIRLQVDSDDGFIRLLDFLKMALWLLELSTCT